MDNGLSSHNYQATIQKIKDEIVQTTNELKNQENNEEIEKMQITYDLCQQDIAELNEELERLKQENLVITAENEKLSQNLGYKEGDQEIRKNIKEIEEENRLLLKTFDSSFSVERMLISGESDQKTLNETFVVLQKKLNKLDIINAELEKKIKKSEADTKNLKKKCENAMGRYKSHDELKEKIKNLEAGIEKYNFIEASLKKEIEEADKLLMVEKARPEYQIDAKTAQKLVSEALDALNQEKNKYNQLENELKEKKMMLHDIRTYGIQPNKITVKLRNELNLVNIVLKEKQEHLEKLEQEIEEYELKNKT